MTLKTYSKEFHLDCFLLDHEGKATLVTYFNLMQEVALKHAMLLGFGKNDMDKRSMFWVLTRMGLKINKTLKWDETIKVMTWSRGIVGPYSFREFKFLNAFDEEIGVASSSWLPLDINSRKPAKLTEQQFINDKSLPNQTVDLTLDKIFIPEKLENGYAHQVVNTDLDINGHANNARYVEWIYNSLPLNFFSHLKNYHFQINYLGEAKLSDNILIKHSPIHDITKEIFISGQNTDTQKSFFSARLN
jgi:acyl-ACP thioesterase